MTAENSSPSSPSTATPLALGLAAVATATMAVSYADRQTLAIVAPSLTAALHISDVTYGWAISAFSLSYLISAPLAGGWIDAIGAKRGLTFAVLAWSAVALLHGLVAGPVSLIGLRIALGTAEAPSFPGAAKTVHNALPARDRPRGMGVLFIGSSVGAMIVAPTAARLAGAYGFRVAFLAVAAVGLLWVPIWLWITRGPPAARLLAGTGERRAPAVPMGTLLLHPAVLRTVPAILATAPLMSYALNWLSKAMVAIFTLSQSQVGNYLWLPPILYDIGSIGFGVLASRRLRRLGGSASPPRALLTAAVVLAGALALVPLATTPWAAVGLVGVAMAGGGAIFALLSADLFARVPPNAVAAAAGVAAAAQSLAYVVANPLIGWGVGHGGHGMVQVWLVAWLVPGTLVWLLAPVPPVHD